MQASTVMPKICLQHFILFEKIENQRSGYAYVMYNYVSSFVGLNEKSLETVCS